MKKRFKPTQLHVDAINEFLTTKNDVEKLTPTVREIQRKVLEKHPIFDDAWEDSTGKQIFSVDQMYLSDDEDIHKEIYNALHKEYQAAGLLDDVPVGYCPLALAETANRKAEKNLLKVMQPFTEVEPNKALSLGLAKYQELIDLTVKFLKPFATI